MSKLDMVVSAFVNTLRNIMREEMIELLQSGTPPKPSGRGYTAPPARTKSKGGKRSPEEIKAQAEKLAKLIRENPGSKSEDLAKVSGMTTGDQVLPIKKLLGEKRIKAKGKARGTTYTAV